MGGGGQNGEQILFEANVLGKKFWRTSLEEKFFCSSFGGKKFWEEFLRVLFHSGKNTWKQNVLERKEMGSKSFGKQILTFNGFIVMQQTRFLYETFQRGIIPPNI